MVADGAATSVRGSVPEDVPRLRLFTHGQWPERRPGGDPARTGAHRLPAQTAPALCGQTGSAVPAGGWPPERQRVGMVRQALPYPPLAEVVRVSFGSRRRRAGVGGQGSVGALGSRPAGQPSPLCWVQSGSGSFDGQSTGGLHCRRLPCGGLHSTLYGAGPQEGPRRSSLQGEHLELSSGGRYNAWPHTDRHPPVATPPPSGSLWAPGLRRPRGGAAPSRQCIGGLLGKPI
mmetsp:Transcript_40305/g.66545  ORF Transcript_40305/g.66545 Transcript_40305/m.66545 type:complete len:231 (+) Transcript_40305:770-1462(+)